MIVRLTEDERVVLRYEIQGSFLLLVHEPKWSPATEHDREVYVVLWAAHTNNLGPDEYELQWRGNLDTCLSKFAGEVEDFERDRFEQGVDAK